MNRFLAIFGACSAIPCIVVLLFFVAPLAAGAQSAGKLHRIGFLGNSTATLEANLVGPFRESLRELGHVEGQNIVIEYRWAEGKYERFPALIAELLAQRVEVIVRSNLEPGRTGGKAAGVAQGGDAEAFPRCVVF